MSISNQKENRQVIRGKETERTRDEMSNSSGSKSYTCLPAGFTFQSYTPLDPQIPSSSDKPCRLVQEALDFLPNFDRDVPAEEKLPVATVAEASQLLAQARAERKGLADLERCIADQVEVEKAMTEAAIATLRKE